MSADTPIRDILLPDTDRTAAIQVAVVALVTLVGAVFARRERSVALLVVGVGTFLLGVMALRTLH